MLIPEYWAFCLIGFWLVADWIIMGSSTRLVADLIIMGSSPRMWLVSYSLKLNVHQ